MPARDAYKFKPVAISKRRSHWSGIGSLILLCLASVLALVLFLAFVTTESRPNVWSTMFRQHSVGKSLKAVFFLGVAPPPTGIPVARGRDRM